jgi:hypothetical protein
MQNYSWDKIFFYHIPKTAGTTFRDIVQDNLVNIDHFYWKDINHKDKLEDDIFSNPNLRFFGGHFTFHDIFARYSNMFTKNTLNIILLREPMDRILSYWHYCNRIIEHKYYNSSHLSFEDAFYEKNKFFLDTSFEQNYYISGMPDFDITLQFLKKSNFIITTPENIYKLIQVVFPTIDIPKDDKLFKIVANKGQYDIPSFKNCNFIEDLKLFLSQDYLLWDMIRSKDYFYTNI